MFYGCIDLKIKVIRSVLRESVNRNRFCTTGLQFWPRLSPKMKRNSCFSMDKRERSDIAITLWEIIKKKRRNPLGKWDLRGLADFILTDYGDFSEIVSD